MALRPFSNYSGFLFFIWRSLVTLIFLSPPQRESELSVPSIISLRCREGGKRKRLVCLLRGRMEYLRLFIVNMQQVEGVMVNWIDS